MTAEMELLIKIEKSPCDLMSDCRKASSRKGLKIKAIIKGAGSKPVFFHQVADETREDHDI